MGKIKKWIMMFVIWFAICGQTIFVIWQVSNATRTIVTFCEEEKKAREAAIRLRIIGESVEGRIMKLCQTQE